MLPRQQLPGLKMRFGEGAALLFNGLTQLGHRFAVTPRTHQGAAQFIMRAREQAAAQ